ncbi:MAG: class I SAM-dependent methyltransferase [Rhodothermales bacterium]
MARWNAKVCGSAAQDLRLYVAEKYFGGEDLVGLSVGCGSGANEIRWYSTGVFQRIDCYDISASRIEEARRAAMAAGAMGVLNFEVGNVLDLNLPAGHYDVVIAENALHHLSPIDTTVSKLAGSLRKEGLVVIRDFVGPSRFQWGPRQLEVANGALRLLPESYRRRWRSNTVKKQVFAPGRLSMQVMDPSEATQSDEIVPALEKHLSLLELKGLGGTVLHLVLQDIAHNFQDDSAETAAWLDLLYQIEDQSIELGELQDDFVVGVFRKTDP